MEQVKISKNSLQDLVIYAQRYSIGRQTYAPKDVKEFILKHLNDLEYNTIKVIIDDIRLQNERNNLGAEMDKIMWLDLLDELEKTSKTTKGAKND